MLMLGELLAVVGRQRAHAGRKRRQQRDHHIGDRLGGLARHMGDQGVTGLTLAECDERLLLTGADDQITPSQSPKRWRLSTMAGRCSIDTWLGMVPRRSRPP
jgi:hypothetical protein